MRSLELTRDLLVTLTELQAQLPVDLTDEQTLTAMQKDLTTTEETLTAIKKTLFILELTK
ncbi:hypothetical protein [Enterococcus sp. CSURQ0835]|uniref:hypothetical protein n=1 Tax=Enterococcus sp. CSURQ0835 TaxID=2681394 RepID=UPI00135A61F9|nr:hypothetical protein [Enterococcus sp. CSURQ0835]